MSVGDQEVPEKHLVGRYEILREIGRGGMAVVYAAHQPDLEREVALKELSRFHAGSAEFAHRFLREARLAGSLSHPNIVTVYEYFEHAGTPYIAMEYVPRGSLRPFVKRLSLAQIGGVLEGVLAALAHAEAAGIVHRDLKPENIMVTADGRVEITDFGIARATQRAGTQYLTATGMTVGTPTYMAPEQAMAGAIGPWTDLYSVGVLTYELIVGRPPFEDSDTPVAILMRHVNEPIPSASEVRPDVDPALSLWIDSLLVKNPDNRIRHALIAWEALEDIILSLLGARWRREARLLEDYSARGESQPLTPAPFESKESIRTPTPTPTKVPEAFVTFEPGRPAPASPVHETPAPEAPAAEAPGEAQIRGAPAAEPPAEVAPSQTPGAETPAEAPVDAEHPPSQTEGPARTATDRPPTPTTDEFVTFGPSRPAAPADEAAPAEDGSPPLSDTPAAAAAPPPAESDQPVAPPPVTETAGESPGPRPPADGGFVTFGRPTPPVPASQPDPSTTVGSPGLPESASASIPPPEQSEYLDQVTEPEREPEHPAEHSTAEPTVPPKAPITTGHGDELAASGAPLEIQAPAALTPEREDAAPPAQAEAGDIKPLSPVAPRPRRGRQASRVPIVILGVIAAAAAATAGFLIAHGSGGQTSTAVPLARTTSTGPISISYPRDWRVAGANQPSATALGLSHAVTLVPAGTDGAMVVGTTADANASLLPRSFAASLTSAPQGATVQLGSHTFRRYLDLLPQGTGPAETVYALPTTTGTVVAACIPPRTNATIFAATCERSVSTLRLTSGSLLPLATNPAFATALSAIIAKLNATRIAAGGSLQQAKSQAAQATAASQLGRAYQDAAAAAAKLNPGPVGADANAAIVAALHRLANAYISLAQAAKGNDAREYGAARSAIGEANSALTAAFAQMRQDGYSIS